MKLGKILKAYMYKHDIDVRYMARILGISSATVSRITRGKNVDAQTFGKILFWLIQPDEKE